MFTYVERYADAATHLNRTDPDTTLLLSMVVGLEVERCQLADESQLSERISLLSVEFRGESVVEWHAAADGVTTRQNTGYRPTAYVGGPEPKLATLESLLTDSLP